MNAKLVDDTQSIESIEERYPSSVVTLISKDDLSNQWQKSIVSGVELLVAAVVLVICVLLVMLGNAIGSSLRERKRDFAILKTIGMDDRSLIRMLFVELLVWQFPTACLALAFTPLISLVFLNLSAFVSGYSVDLQIDFVSCFGAWALTMLVMAATSVILFVKQKKISPIDSLGIS